MNIFQQLNAKWICPCGIDKPNQYIRFFQDFNLDRIDSSSSINISCDTNYALWLNGQFVHYAQFHDWQWEKTYDSFNISSYLKKGSNTLRLFLYYQGQDSAQYVPAQPGVVFALVSGGHKIISGGDTYWQIDPCYRSGDMDRITPQLHFSFEYDSGKDDNWLSNDFDHKLSFKQITENEITSITDDKDFKIRPIARTLVNNRIKSSIITQGYFKQAVDGNIARQMHNAFLSYRDRADIFQSKTADFPAKVCPPPKDCDGIYLIFDLQSQSVGLFELDIDAKAGTIIDIGYGEHLEDMRVRTSIGIRNFANRYIAKNGRQQFTHCFTRFAGRYIQLHISNQQSDLTIHYAGLRAVDYPIEQKSSFQSGCQLQNAIYKTSVRTLQLSMHEHYEDCPWREQALYANDARNQALCGYYCFGEYDFPAGSLDLLGKGLKDDGFLELCAPAVIPITIPSFTFAWIMAVADHLLYSGDNTFATSQLEVITKIIDARLGDLNEGVLGTPKGSRYWHFYDWADGLDGTVLNDCTKFADLQELRFDAIYNLYFYLALESAVFIFANCQQNKYADKLKNLLPQLKQAIHKAFFNTNTGLYMTYTGKTQLPEHYAQLTQSLAVLAKVCSDEQAAYIRAQIADDNSQMTKTTLSQSLYKFQALLTDKPKYGKFVFDTITADWGAMLFKGATSFWETLKGASDFDNAGSLCHGWSAIPVYLYYAHLIGITPTEPGFKEFVFEPCTEAIDNHKAEIKTASGMIKISLKKVKDKVDTVLKYPDEIKITEKTKSNMKYQISKVQIKY